jgi:hypothetical protein
LKEGFLKILFGQLFGISKSSLRKSGMRSNAQIYIAVFNYFLPNRDFLPLLFFCGVDCSS